MKVLIVEDDLALADVISFTLRREGFEVISAHDGLAALDRWVEASPDLIILDLNLPKLDGLAVCQRIRSESNVPIIMLTVRAEDDDVVRGLEMGADDYIAKPFSPKQLIARAQAVLRRAGVQAAPGPINVGRFTLDPSRHEVRFDGADAVSLTSLESKLLETLMINQGHVLPADALIRAIWGPDAADRAMLKQLVYRLRKKIEADPDRPIIETVPGVGYAFSEPSKP
jgi:DNA-binding response OmpR family regulator